MSTTAIVKQKTTGLFLPEPESSLRLLIDVHDTARALSICERTLATMTKAGEIPHVRVRKRVLYAPHVLRQWIDGRTQGGGAAVDLAETVSEK